MRDREIELSVLEHLRQTPLLPSPDLLAQLAAQAWGME